jgi:peptidoglycan DL-endopeptidase CwlO
VSTDFLDRMQLVSHKKGNSLLLQDAITDSPTLSLSIDGASTLTLPLDDHERRLARSEVLATRCWATVLGLNFELAGVAKTGDDVELTFEDAIAAQLRRQQKKGKVPANSTTRHDLLVRLAREARVKYSIDPAKRPKIRNVVDRAGTDSWELTGTVASDIQWRRFSNGKRLVAGGDDWLLEKDPKPTVFREHTGPVGNIDFDLDAGKRASTVTLELDAEYGALTIGDTATVPDYPALDGKWLIGSYTLALTSDTAEVELVRRQHTLKEPKGTGGKGEKGEDGFLPDQEGSAPGGTAANDARERMVRWALAQNGKAYVWGGNGPDAFDCSGLVQGATSAGGKTLGKPSLSQWSACVSAGVTIPVSTALRTRGALLFRIGVDSTNHVAISLGNGSTIEAMGTAYGVLVAGNAASRGWTGAALWI